MTDDALPLDSPRWSALSTPCGNAGDVPDLLIALLDRRSLSLDDIDGPWFRLLDRIYHQQSLYGATFASMPHLVAIASLVGSRDRQEVCVAFGMIASALLLQPEPIPPDLARPFARASSEAADMTVRLLATEPIGKDAEHLPSFGVLELVGFGALALVGHRAGRLVHANLSPSSAEVECECSACGASYLVLLLPEGVARYTEPDVFPTLADADQPALRLPRPPRSTASSATPWSMLAASFESARRAGRSIDGQPLADPSGEVAACLELAAATCRAGIDSETDLTLALVVAAAVPMLNGHTDHGRQLLRLAGPIRCPECDAVEPLASQMLDFADT